MESFHEVEGRDKLLDRMQSLINQGQNFDQNQTAHVVRALLACLLAVEIEQAMDSAENPIPQLNDTLEALSGFLSCVGAISDSDSFKRYVNRNGSLPVEPAWETVEQKTGTLYSDLFSDYDQSSYFQEALELLSERLTRNNVPLNWIQGKSCLDAGCGGGRYTAALARLGAKHVFGVDIGADALKDAAKRAAEAGISNVSYRQSSVLELPFPDNTFDFAFSNGVLHHTTNPEKGLKEIYRVLNPGGKIWLHIAEKYGFANASINMMRDLLKPVPRELTQELMCLLGFDSPRRFYFLDPWYAPIRIQYTATEVEELLKRYGFKNARRLMRDVSTPHYTGINELIFKQVPYAAFWYGEGRHRYIAEK